MYYNDEYNRSMQDQRKSVCLCKDLCILLTAANLKSNSETSTLTMTYIQDAGKAANLKKIILEFPVARFLFSFLVSRSSVPLMSLNSRFDSKRDKNSRQFVSCTL